MNLLLKSPRSHTPLCRDPTRLQRAKTATIQHPRAMPELQYAGDIPSLEEISQAIPGSSDNGLSNDSRMLVAFLSSFSPRSMIPLDLFRGATPRKRWAKDGNLEDTRAEQFGLVTELCGFLSSNHRLKSGFRDLEALSVVSQESDQAYSISDGVTKGVLEKLSPESLDFWKTQALLVLYRSIPWKYIDPM